MNSKTRVAGKGDASPTKPKFDRKEIPLPPRSLGIELPAVQYPLYTLVDFICEQKPNLRKRHERIHSLLNEINNTLIRLFPTTQTVRLPEGPERDFHTTMLEYIMDIAVLHYRPIKTLERFLSVYDSLNTLQQKQNNGKGVKPPENANLFLRVGGLRKIYGEAAARYDGRKTSFAIHFPFEEDSLSSKRGLRGSRGERSPINLRIAELPDGQSIEEFVDFAYRKRPELGIRATFAAHLENIDKLLKHKSLGRARKSYSERREMLRYMVGMAILDGTPITITKRFEITYALIVDLYKRREKGEKFVIELGEEERLKQFLEKVEMFSTVEGLQKMYEEARKRGAVRVDFLIANDLPLKAERERY